MENQMTISTVSDEVYDSVFIHKLFSNPALLRDLEFVKIINELHVYDEFVDEFVDKLMNLNEIGSLRNEGRIYEFVENILQNGAEGNLVPGWSKRFLEILEMNSSNICNAIRPS